MTHIHLTLTPQIIALLSVVLPSLVALVTKRWADSSVKAIVLLALTAVVGTFDVVRDNGGGFDVAEVFWDTLITFLTAVAMHFGLLAPVRVTGSDGVIQRGTADFGVGGSGPSGPAVRSAR